MKKILRGVIVLIAAFILIPLVKADVLDDAPLETISVKHGDAFVTTCNPMDGVAVPGSFECRIVKWYKGGETTEPGNDVGLVGTYDGNSNYIVEIAIEPTGEYELGETMNVNMIGYPLGTFIRNENGEAIVRFNVWPKHLVHFETYGGTVYEDIYVEHMDSLHQATGMETLPTPTKTHSTFFGWFTDSEFEEKANTHICLEENTTYYALFADNDYVISTINVELEAPVIGTVVTNTPYIDPIWGYATVLQDPRPVVYVGELSPYTSDYASWVKGVCLNGDYESCEQNFSGTIEEDTYYYASISVATKEGYYFNPTDFRAYVNGDEVEEYFAIFDGTSTYFIAKIKSTELEECKAHFNMNGGSALIDKEVTCGETIHLPNVNEVVAPDNKILDGWTDGENNFHPGEEVEPYGVVTYTAIWANLYTVTFDLNGKPGYVPSQQVKEGGLVVPPEEPTTGGFLFVKWCKERECENTFEFETDEITENTTIYACWEEDPDIFELRLYSDTTSVYEGVLPQFVVTTNTQDVSVQAYGSNTNWLQWPEGYSSWHGFGADEPTAVADGTTHYALRIQVDLENGRKFSKNLKVFFNDEDISGRGKSAINKGFSWGIYVYVDLGTALERRDPINLITIKGVIEPKEGEHPTVEGLEIETEGLSIHNAMWIRESNEQLLTEDDTYLGNQHYILRIEYEKEEDVTFAQNVDVVANVESLMEDFIKEREEIRLYYNSKTKVVPKVTVAPTVKVKNAENNTLLVSWNEVENAEKYTVYQSEDNKTWKNLGTTTDLSYVATGLTYGKVYYYKVKASNKTNGKTSSVVKGKTIPNKVENLHVEGITSTSVKLGYDKVSVSGYEIHYSTDNKTFTKLGTLTSNKTLEYNAKSLKSNKTYYFKVRAYKTVSGSKVYGTFSSVVSAKTAPAKPKIKLAVKDEKSMNLTITLSKGASKYVVERSVDNKEYESVFEVNEAKTYALEEQESGLTYYVRVKACNKDDNCSPWTKVSLKQTTKTPKFSLTTSSKKVTISITAVSGASGYQIYRLNSKTGKYENIKIFTIEEELLEFVDKTKTGKTYYYKVRSFTYADDGKEVYSPFSSVKSITSK